MRKAGILLHITSLPSPHGVGTLGAQARCFVDFLSGAGQSCWQILPLGPTGYGDSPYQTFSTFAGNPYLIDLDELVTMGLLTAQEVSAADGGGDTEVDFGRLYENRRPLLQKACLRGWDSFSGEIEIFRKQNESWLPDCALYMAAKDRFGGTPWYDWPEELRACHISPEGAQTAEAWREKLDAEVKYHIFVQFLFFRQWNALRDYARGHGIKFIGDVPIYVPLDSADVWASPGSFQLDGSLRPSQVAGVPPDGFSADGQLWGNPLYDWEAMEKDGFRWWKARLRAAGRMFDIVRIDHFRGLSAYWSVPAGETTAKNGSWRPGPGRAFIDAVKNEFPDMRFIAEDLGYLNEDVRRLVEYSGFPGMKVLEFAFDPREPSDYLPHTYDKNCVCYTGTHDNATLVQWLGELSVGDREYARAYLGLNGEEGYPAGVIRGGMASSAELFMAQMQDWLELGGEARMNTPGTFGAPNWRWRMRADALTDSLQKRIHDTTGLYGRGGGK